MRMKRETRKERKARAEEMQGESGTPAGKACGEAPLEKITEESIRN